ncbi:hypothetical protein THASP1DRAFT_26599 [Thamnocephalis sphaerospora]|uniref:RGS domain-containing protein n=1 Tax=Thamnocephalis sphaerospora TaxID=78915 RepID=A0A4P9XGR7_9FUNG|nr:hypothetical protein THASP1DRAFT_26599 [Thamnocephalis sphaerospora]|eukprot:RKP04822.1 hypothetical protein THASP1DRAFT_26599 [Thamnocephalis sphaerospora]
MGVVVAIQTCLLLASAGPIANHIRCNVVALPVAFFVLRRIRDAYKTRLEITLLMLNWNIGFVVYIPLMLVLKNSNRPSSGKEGELLLTIVIAATCVLSHAISVCMPVFLVKRESKGLADVVLQQKPDMDGDGKVKLAEPQQRRWYRNGRRPQGRYQSLSVHLSHAEFRKVLRDPRRFREFKDFTVGDLSVENVLFYEGCRLIIRMARRSHRDTIRQSASAQGGDALARSLSVSSPAYVMRSSALQSRLIWFSNTFLCDNAELQVNLTAAMRQQLFDEIMRVDAPFRISVLRSARDEIEELMFRDTYQRFMLTKVLTRQLSSAEVPPADRVTGKRKKGSSKQPEIELLVAM